MLASMLPRFCQPVTLLRTVSRRRAPSSILVSQLARSASNAAATIEEGPPVTLSIDEQGFALVTLNRGSTFNTLSDVVGCSPVLPSCAGLGVIDANGIADNVA